MLTRIPTLFSLIIIQSLSLIHSSILPRPPPFNLSHFLYPKVTAFTDSNIPSQPPDFLQGVLDTIAKKEKWELADVRVSELDVRKAKYRSAQAYEFRVRVGKSEIVLKMHEEMSEWKKLAALVKNGSSNFEALAKGIGSKALVESFKIEGPFELRVARDDDQLTLVLPSNISRSGLRRISVGEGITLEVKGAEEISLFHPSDRHQLPYGVLKTNRDESIWPAFCTALPPIRILGSASVVAYRTRRPAASIQTISSSEISIELLPDKCYTWWPNYKTLGYLFSSLSEKISSLERVLRSFLNKSGDSQNASLGSSSSLKARIRASTLFQFQLRLEKDIRSNDSYWSTLADWRTRPIVERVLFEVVARIEGEIMKPLVIKKVRPFIDTDSFAWSSLLSNLSFTKFPSVLVPPEALTLDVKW